MPKVGSSLVDIPVTVNREKVFIMTRFRKRRQMSVIEGDDGPDHDNDGRRAGDSPEPKPGLDVVQVIHDQSGARQRNLLQQRSARQRTKAIDGAQVNYDVQRSRNGGCLASLHLRGHGLARRSRAISGPHAALEAK
jgi:hypothetical protein